MIHVFTQLRPDDYLFVLIPEQHLMEGCEEHDDVHIYVALQAVAVLCLSADWLSQETPL